MRLELVDLSEQMQNESVHWIVPPADSIRIELHDSAQSLSHSRVEKESAAEPVVCFASSVFKHGTHVVDITVERPGRAPPSTDAFRVGVAVADQLQMEQVQ